MTHLSLTLVAIVVIFLLFLWLRSIFSLQVCALCAGVSITWLTLLVLLYVGIDVDPLLVGILIGGSIVGGMYLLEDKLPEKYHIFRLPFFLTLVTFGYSILSATIALTTVVIVGITWLLGVGLFVWRNRPGVNAAVQKIIQCCKNW